MAAETNRPRLRGFQQQESVLSEPGVRKSEIEVWPGPPLPVALREGLFLPLPLPAALGAPELKDPSLSHMAATPALCLPVTSLCACRSLRPNVPFL